MRTYTIKMQHEIENSDKKSHKRNHSDNIDKKSQNHKYMYNNFCHAYNFFSGNYPRVKVLDIDIFQVVSRLMTITKNKKIVIHDFADDSLHVQKLYQSSTMIAPDTIRPREVSLFYTENVDFEVEVPDEYNNKLIKINFQVDVLTASALKNPPLKKRESDEVYVYKKSIDLTYMYKKIQLILATLKKHEANYFITGDWAVGSLGNPVQEVAEIWASAIHSLPQCNFIFCFPENNVANQAKKFTIFDNCTKRASNSRRKKTI